jgi:hypothetical protein
MSKCHMMSQHITLCHSVTLVIGITLVTYVTAGRTVYVAASKIFQLDNLRDTDDVIEAMKRGYEVSIGGSFFAGSEGSAQIGQQDGTGNQHDDPEMDNGKEGAQPEQDQDAQPQQRKKATKDANKPSKIQCTRDQGHRKM